MQTVEIEFSQEDLRAIQAAAYSCRLDFEEFVRLTLVGQLRGASAVQTEEARCPQHRHTLTS